MNDNKFYKVLRIIFLTLAIVSMVFGLCKKVGLCASDVGSGSGSSDEYLVLTNYFPIGAGCGNNFSFSELDTVVANIKSVIPYDSDFPSCDLICVYESSPSNNTISFVCFSGISSDTLIITNNLNNMFSSGAEGSFKSTSTNYYGFALVSVDLSTLNATFVRWNRSQLSFNSSQWITPNKSSI